MPLLSDMVLTSYLCTVTGCIKSFQIKQQILKDPFERRSNLLLVDVVIRYLHWPHIEV
jgi:hypothetical protein